MRVLVCGGRDYSDREHTQNTLTELHARRGPITTVIHGAARGADTEGMLWAIATQGVGSVAFPADWNRYGKAAGAMRNERMLTEGKPDLVVAFPGGVGTADMVRRAKKAGVEVILVLPRMVTVATR